MRCCAIMPQSRKSSPYLHWMWDSAFHTIALRGTAPKLVGHAGIRYLNEVKPLKGFFIDISVVCTYFYIVSTYHVFDRDGGRSDIRDGWDQVKWHVASIICCCLSKLESAEIGFPVLSCLFSCLLFFLFCLPFWYYDSKASTTGRHTILIKLRRSYMATSRNSHGRFGGPGWCSGS